MHFIPPQPGNFEEMRKYLDAGASDAHGGWGQKERKAWIHERLFTCQYEHLGRAEKGQVRQFLQKITGYSRAQIAREIAVYRLEKSALGQEEPRIKSPEEGLGNLNPTPSPSPLTPLPRGEGNETIPSPFGRMAGDEGVWKRLFRFALISSLIVNIAFVLMLLGMSLLERAEKAREKNPVLALPPAIESTEQPIHAAPSTAPMP